MDIMLSKLYEMNFSMFVWVEIILNVFGNVFIKLEYVVDKFVVRNGLYRLIWK